MTAAELAALITRLADERPMLHREAGQDVSSAATTGTLMVLARELRTGQRTLETGCGASTVVFAAAGTQHTAVSPNPVEHDRVVRCCESLGVHTGHVSFVAARSDDALPGFDDVTLDVVLIDGAHSFPHAIIDWHFLHPRLKRDGLLLLDDVPIPSVAILFRYLNDSPAWRLEEVIDRRAAVYRKLDDERDDGDFRSQPFNSQYPDYSFLPLWERAWVAANLVQHRARGMVTRGVPVVRRLLRSPRL